MRGQMENPCLEETIRTMVNYLQECQIALISEAVTSQIDVREAS